MIGLRKYAFIIFLCTVLVPATGRCQDSTVLVDALRLKHWVQVLAADSLQGRGNFTPELKKATDLIRAEFAAAGLLPFSGTQGYLQFFSLQPLPPENLAGVDEHNYDPKQLLANVVGIIPGTTHPEEMVIFSAHYDHVGAEPSGKDRIFNGANDNASGTAAMLALVEYFARQKNNGRTLVFCAFAGEELGLVGSKHFVRTIDPKQVSAVINLEMLGRTGAAGYNGFFITGAAYSNFESMVKKNLAGGPVKVRREAFSRNGDLFSRSDNYPFARLGIAAHTIMSSDDSEPCYHRSCDEWPALNFNHLTNITNAMIRATAGIVAGTEKPNLRRIPEE